MKNFIYSAITFLLLCNSILAQAPTWTVNENNYQYTMTFVGFLNSDGTDLINANDKVAAFVNGECRGVAKVIFVASANRYCTYLTVFSNTNNEIVDFKIYDSTKNIVKNLDKTMPFKTNEHYGNLFQAYSFASPALKVGAAIIDVSFAGIVKNNITFSGSQITVYLNKGQDLSALNTTFTLSSGASIYIGTEKQSSGAKVYNFTNPLQLNVLSEDQSVVKPWTIVVKTATGIGTFYKKDAVCYEGGSIKILFSTEKEIVVLSSNGVELATQTINNGQAIFNNLSDGIYKVSVGDNFKEITIKK